MILKRMISSILVFVPLVLHAVPGQACRAAPAGQLIGVDQQIASATDVAVGQVISATPMDDQNVEYRFLLLDRLAGQPERVFTVMGESGVPGDQDTTFNDHADFTFWAHGGGRVMNHTDCIIHPAFVIGSSYLIFLRTPVTRRSLEKIAMVNGVVNPDDRWLMYVKQQLADRQVFARPAISVTPSPQRDFERIGRFIYGFYRIVARADLDRKTLASRQVPPELVQRAGRLGDEFDHILGGSTIRDAELEATLAEAVAVEKMLAAWSANGGGEKSPTR